jgi:hypothetical protein
MAFRVYAEGRTTRGVERDGQHLVGNVMFCFYLQLTFSQCCTATLQYYSFSLRKEHPPKRRPYWKEGHYLRTSTWFVLFFFGVLMPLAEHLTCRP